MNKISVRQSEDRFYWWVFFECCGERSMRMYDWTFAMHVANKHLSDYHAPQVLTAGANSSPSKTAEKEGAR